MTPASNAPKTPYKIDPSPWSDKMANTIPAKAAVEATDKSKLPEIMSIVEGKANTESTDTARRILRALLTAKKYSDFEAKKATTAIKKMMSIASVEPLANIFPNVDPIDITTAGCVLYVYLDDTVGVLLYRLAATAAKSLMTVLEKYRKCLDIPLIKQDETLASHAPLVKAEHLKIDWKESAVSIENLVRAANPVGGAWTVFRGFQMKVWHVRGRSFDGPSHVAGIEKKPGMLLLSPSERELIVCTGDGCLALKVVQPALYYILDGWSFNERSMVQDGEILE